jgi:hypothetical protein
MTLSVNTYALTMDGDRVLFDPEAADAPRNDLFGVEKCRTELWGAPIMQSLGLELLPSLKIGNIYAEFADLETLEAEAQTVLNNLVRIADQTLYATDYIAFRILNLVQAVNKARSLADQYPVVGVMIS